MIKLHLIVLVLTALAPLLVWRAGESPVLTFVDYRTIENRSAFNRFAALRLLPMPAVALLCLVLVSARPELGLPLLFLEALALFASVNWVSMGASGFKVASYRTSAA